MNIGQRLREFLSRPVVGHFGPRASRALCVLVAGALLCTTALAVTAEIESRQPLLIDGPGRMVHINLDNPMGHSLADAAIGLAAHVRADPLAERHQRAWKKYPVPAKLAVLESYQAEYLKAFPGVPRLPIAHYDDGGESMGYVNDATPRILYRHPLDWKKPRAPNVNVSLSDDFQADLNTMVHETVHVVQISYLARALLNQLEAEKAGTPLAEDQRLIGTVARTPWLTTRASMIDGLRTVAGRVVLPPGHEVQMRQMLVSALLTQQQYDRHYLKVYMEQQAFKTADCMTRLTEAPEGGIEMKPAALVKATFLACADSRLFADPKPVELKQAHGHRHGA